MAEVNDRSGALLKLGVLLAILVGGVAIAKFSPLGQYLSRDGIGQAIEWIRASESAPVLYVLIYAAATALAIPGSILTLAGGAMFGVAWGTVYTTLGANIGANVAFGVGRFLGRDGVRKLAGERLDALDKATNEHGFRGLLTLRLIPAVPFNALNFGSGLTSMSWGTYAVATLVGILPGTIVYTMFADALLAGSQEASREAFLRVLGSGALLVFLSFLPTIAKRIGIRVPGAAPSAVAVLVAGQLLVTAPDHARAQSLPSHDPFTELLSDVVEQPLVDYEELVDRRGQLDAYLQRLGAVPTATIEASSREEQLAFWINAYNACMLQLVADHYPIQKAGGLLSNIKNSVAGRPANSVWQIEDVFSRDHCRIAGEDRSQDEIEHELIRPLGEPRIHFAVNCAARSCPVLWPEAYVAERLDEQLDRAVKNLIANPEHFQVDGSTVRMNKVLDWYKEDFGGVDGLRSFFQPYLPASKAALITDPDTDIEFFDYDWTLNDTGA